MCIKTMSLEVSENTHERRELVAVGTALIRGEDLPSQGRIYIFDIINVVPEPGHPETDRKLKLITKEEVKGAVTALSEIGTQGFLLAAQGQKCMVRGLKEDGTLLPVAFMDMQCYVSIARELKGTGLCIMGDAIKGAWLTGYSEEPYQLRLFSKTPKAIEVLTGDFLPSGKSLFIALVDADTNLHLLQFNPEHPKSLSGQRLLHLHTFHTGHFPSTTTLLPRTPTSYESLALPSSSSSPASDAIDTASEHPAPALHHILLTTQTGALALLTPLSEPAYRRLSALSTYLLTALPHPLGLNPRAYRAVDGAGTIDGGGAGVGGGGSRGVVDGGLVRRWMELGSWKRAEGVGRVSWGGGEEGEWGVRGDLEGIGGAGLGFL